MCGPVKQEPAGAPHDVALRNLRFRAERMSMADPEAPSRLGGGISALGRLAAASALELRTAAQTAAVASNPAPRPVAFRSAAARQTIA